MASTTLWPPVCVIRNLTFVIQHVLDEFILIWSNLFYLGSALGKLHMMLCIIKMKILGRISTGQANNSLKVEFCLGPLIWGSRIL